MFFGHWSNQLLIVIENLIFRISLIYNCDNEWDLLCFISLIKIKSKGNHLQSPKQVWIDGDKYFGTNEK